ncbi:MAG: phosphate acyltransferase, partial [Methylocella sp.]
FHDDQHGTAIITSAAVMNALELVGKPMNQVQMLFNGAGASGIACANLLVHIGARRENITMCDSEGVIYKGRAAKMNAYKEKYALDTKLRTLKEAFKGKDIFIGLSVAGCVTRDMIRSMAEKPIIFALANPDPEITYDDAKAARPDIIMATGRSDYPNQVNNVLGFPFIFRGALDVRATTINTEMKVAASRALATLAKQSVPEDVTRAYGGQIFEFGPEYIIPKPFDPRVLLWVAPAVAKAAMDTGVAQLPVNLVEYKERLASLMGRAREAVHVVIEKAKLSPRRVVFPEGEEEKILKAAQLLVDEGIANPILLGEPPILRRLARKWRVDLAGFEIVRPESHPRFEEYAIRLHELRKRKGVT